MILGNRNPENWSEKVHNDPGWMHSTLPNERNFWRWVAESLGKLVRREVAVKLRRVPVTSADMQPLDMLDKVPRPDDAEICKPLDMAGNVADKSVLREPNLVHHSASLDRSDSNLTVPVVLYWT